ncbi:MAG: hypothetical protein WCK07_20670, partial [Betaproteobacteria bacterium]
MKGLLQIAVAAVLLIAAAAARAADEPEVEVRGCVVDSGGRPFRNVNIELSGLNYRGGAGYAGNNSVDTTNEQGEFSLRMKAGTKEAPARAQLAGRYEVYVTPGWNGGKKFGGADVWPDLPPIQNIGQPVDLRRNGCIRFNYPFDVSGTVVSELLDVSPYPSLTLRITVGSAYSTLSTYIPKPGVTPEFNFGIDLRNGDAYTVDVPRQPRGAQCDIVAGASGYGGEPGTVLLESSYNIWTSKRLQVSCRKAPVEKTEAEKEKEAAEKAAADKLAAEPVLLRRGANSSGTELFANAVSNAE